MFKVGITGGIASGKSMIAGIIQKLNYPVFYADAEARTIMENNENVISKLIFEFGKDVYRNGVLNKSYLSNIVFHEPEKREKINSIVHPEVWNVWDFWCRKQSSPLLFMESALLFQTGFYKNLNSILCVNPSVESRINRLSKRDNLTCEESLIRISNQAFVIPVNQIYDLYIINNESDDEMLLEQVLLYIQNLKK